MSDPVRVVTEFIEAINSGPDGFEKAVRGWFTPRTVWENVGMGTTTGPEQALGLMQNMAAAGIRNNTNAIAFAVSQSSGSVRVFQRGEEVLHIEPLARPHVWQPFKLETHEGEDEGVS